MQVLRYHPRAALGDGGITNSVWEHSRALVRHGVDVAVAFDRGSPPDRLEGVHPTSVEHRGRFWRVPIGIEEVLRSSDVLVLHSAWTPHNIYAASLARRIGVPYVLEPRGAYNPRILGRNRALKRVFWRAWERELVMGAAAIQVFFDEEEPDIRSLGYEGPVIVAPNGVRTPDDAPRWAGSRDSYILWLGRYDPEHKGIDLLVRATASLGPGDRVPLRLHGPDWRGGKRRLNRLVSALGMDAHVVVGDGVYGPAKYELMAGAAAFVYPSRWEAFGNAPAEAGTLGVPLLLTSYPLARHLANLGAAIRVSSDVDGLREGLIAVRNRSAAAMGAQAAEVFRSFTWERVVARWWEQVEVALA